MKIIARPLFLTVFFTFVFSHGTLVFAAPVPQEKINALTEAMSRKDEAAVSDLLKQDTNLCNAVIWGTRRPLHVALENGWNEVVDLLLKNGADPNVEGDPFYSSNSQTTPIEVAIRFNRAASFKRLLEAGANLNHRSAFHGPALKEAFEQHRDEMAALLLEKGANPFLEDMSYWRRTPVELAITQSDGRLVAKMLKSSSVKKEARTKFLAEHGPALLTRAAERGELEAVEALLAANVPVAAGDTNGLTCLQSVARAFAAAKKQNHFVAERWEKIHALLLKNGGQEDAFSATGFGDLPAVQKFSKAAPAVAQSNDNEGQGLLHWSVLTDQLPFTDFWLASGARIDATNAAGQTPLHLAAASGLTNHVARLLAANAPLDLKDTNGLTAFAAAVQAKQTEAIKLLLPKNQTDGPAKHGIAAPLHQASASGDFNALTNALAGNTNLETHDELGFTPLQLAVKSGHLLAATALLDAGADVNAHDAKGNTALQLIMLEPPNWIADQPPITWYARVHRNEQLKYLFPYLVGNDEGQRGAVFQAAVFLLANKAATAGTNDAGQSVFDLATKESVMFYSDADRANLLKLLGSPGGESESGVNAGDADGNTALHRAALDHWGDAGKVAQLIAAGAEVNATNFAGRTPLHLAVKKISSWPYNGGSDSAVMALLKSGAKTDLQDTNGMTALHHLALADENNSFRVKAVQALLEAGADPKIRDRQGRTPAHLFLTGKWPWSEAAECVELLAKAGADLSAKDDAGKTPLHYLAQLGGNSQSPLFFMHNIGDTFVGAKSDFQAREDDGNTPLHLAAKSGAKDVFDWLIKQGASLDATNNAGETPRKLALHSSAQAWEFRTNPDTDIIAAIRQGKLESVESILKSEPELINQTNQYGQTPLLTAAQFNRTNIVEFLARRGARWDEVSATIADRAEALQNIVVQKPSVATNAGLLHLAAQYDAAATAAVLVAAGADLNATDIWGLSPLGDALLRKKTNVANFFVQHGAVKNIFDAAYLGDDDTASALLAQNKNFARAVNQSKLTPAAAAAAAGHLKILELLFENGARLNPTNGTSALHAAAIYNRTNIAEWLVRKGADVKALDRQGFTPLHLAVIQNSTETVALLLKRGFFKRTTDPDIRTTTSRTNDRPRSSMMFQPTLAAGNTALHLAALNAQTNIIALLLAAGASVNATNAAEMTPLDFAVQQRFGGPPIAFFIQRSLAFGPPDLFHGANPNLPIFPPARQAAASLLEKAGAKHGENFRPNGMPGFRGGF